ncbi:hypothetical protein LTR12_018102 [Friedmanniomyces endolithicus]|nr:hypothetical protein LTR12_018102 [Friedmanniomyces endolithicus]
MAAPSSSRTFASAICHSCRQRLLPAPRRFFRTSPTHHAADGTTDRTALGNLSSNIARTPSRANNSVGNYTKTGSSFLSVLDSGGEFNPDDEMNSLLTDSFGGNLNAANADKPHRLHVYATKHNTHLTLVQPSRPASQTPSSMGITGTTASASDQKKIVDVLLSLSTGHVGFRKAGRGSYDAAYQLAAFTFKQIVEKGILNEIKYMEVVFRGFGAGPYSRGINVDSAIARYATAHLKPHRRNARSPPRGKFRIHTDVQHHGSASNTSGALVSTNEPDPV